ncbi:MAG: LptE family protein [Bacteroidetes bacterium]|nr:LptE family protein [Bacteroidota bacterium]
MKNALSIFLISSVLLSACGIYSFTGASISPEVETVSIAYFPNNAPMVQPTLSNTFTESLKDKFISQTNLDLLNNNGDLHFEGSITGYKVKPIAIQANETAAQNRLTISVKVAFTNAFDEENNFSKSFSRFADYSSTQDLSAVETELIEQIVDELTEDIFNKAVANW